MKDSSALRWRQLLLSATLTILLVVQIKGQDASGDGHDDVPPLILPPLKPLPESSFRGPFADDLQVPHFEASGQTTRISTTPDFLRLLPPEPLAHGAIYGSQKIKAKEWIVEIAFRLHGAVRTGSKGGRGLAFWFTKGSTPMLGKSHQTSLNTISDSALSFFGQSQNFDGLDNSGVVSALLDDGTAGDDWFDQHEEGQHREPHKEARYLDRVAGECQAAFRNAPGLVWMRVSHFNREVRVDLDLQPHTQLSQEERHFRHHCFTVKDVQLPTGYHFGLTALASGNTEPDAVDIYAFDAWEVTGKADKNSAADPEQRPPPVVVVPQDSAPLAGTEIEATDESSSMLQEVLIAQSRTTEALDSLSRRMDALALQMGSGFAQGQAQAGDNDLSGRGSGLSAQLSGIQQALERLTGPAAPDGRTAEELEHASIAYLVTTLQQTLAEAKGLTIRMDNYNTRSGTTLSTLLARMGDVHKALNQQVRDQREAREAAASSVLGVAVKALLGLGGLGTFVVLGLAANNWRKDRSGGRGKKMI